MGIMFSFAASALIGVLQFFSNAEHLQAFVMWGLGSFSAISLAQVPLYAILTILAFLAVVPLLKPLDILNVGESYLEISGFRPRRVKIAIILVAGFLTALTTAFCGPLAFIGLAVPHVIRNIFQTVSHKKLLPAVLLGGAIFGLFTNYIVRIPGFNGVLPVSAVTYILGAPIVIWIVIRKKNISL